MAGLRSNLNLKPDRYMIQMWQRFVVASGLLFLAWAAQAAGAPGAANRPYLDTRLTAEQRAADLVGRMTLAEKASEMQNNSAAVPRLNIPAYQWWSEALHGVINEGVTEYPEPIGLAATFDTPAIRTMATQIGIEGRIKHVQNAREGHIGLMGGLDFWSPNLNIFRDPRWGRGQETYGEDPFLTARMGVAYVSGLQGDNPRYYLAIATPKHYAVHSGPEPTRHFADIDVSKHDEMDTYEPAFRAAIVEGKAGSIMCAYNAINGEPACANQYLLQDQLRGKWGFKGYVVSDCDAVRDVAANHRYRPTQAQGAAISVIRGVDNECVTFTSRFGEPVEKAYIDAVQQGYLPESALDTALTRLFTARMRLGMFDPPEMVPYAAIDEKQLDSAEHRALALRLANESMVLLKNDGILPLKPALRNIALIGPLANQTKVLLGNYAGKPTHSVSILDGLKSEFPNAKITYISGIQFLRDDGRPVPDSVLSNSTGEQGLKAEYGEPNDAPDAPSSPVLASRTETNINLSKSNLPAKLAGMKTIAVKWAGAITAAETGDYLVGVRGTGLGSLMLDGKQVTRLAAYDDVEAATGRFHFVKGQKAELAFQYTSMPNVSPRAQLIWAKVDDAVSPEAVAAAKDADMVIAVVGITSRLEGEEMPVTIPGFLGGDRTRIDLPEPEEALIEAVSATGKPMAVVLLNGSALAVNWISRHANAVLESWYPGEEGGLAVAETLSGKNNPAGRLPVTFYTGIDQLPNFEDYGMANRTYRYFDGRPLYPFGYGLSYATFSYSDLRIPARAVRAGEPVSAAVTVTNTGGVGGDEVVQLYLKFPAVKGAPRIALRGFQRIHLNPGKSQRVHFELANRDLALVTEDGQPIIAAGNYIISIGGGQPDTGASVASGKFLIEGQLGLAE
jgi:beta-glucosidase